MFDSNLLKEEEENEQPDRIRDIVANIKGDKFDPRFYLSSQFRFNYGATEDDIIQNLKNQLENAESDLVMIEKEIEKESSELRQKQDLEQNNNYYQLQNINIEYDDLVKSLESISQTVGLEYEQIKTVGDELSELNSMRDEKMMLSDIMKVFDAYQKKANEDGFGGNLVEEGIGQDGANSLLVKLDCLKASLETLNYEEFGQVKKLINEDFDQAKKQTLNHFRQYLDKGRYEEARKMFEFIEKIGDLEGAEKVYENRIAGDRKFEYGLTDKQQNMREFIAYLFSLGIELQDFQQEDSIFIKVHGERAGDILSRVSMRVMRNKICDLTSNLLGRCFKESKTEFFLYYLDEMNIKFEEFMKKNKDLEKIWATLETLSEAYNEVIEKYQTMYFEIEKNEFSFYLDQKIALKLGEVKKAHEKAKVDKDLDVSKTVLKEVDQQLTNENIEEFVNRAKSCFDRCFRNSLFHMRADNCGDLLILFMTKITDYLDKLIASAEMTIPDPLDPNPARIELFSIVSKVLILIKRVDLFFLEFKTKITNMFKLDEAEKVKMHSLKILSEKISGTLNFAMRNLFAEVSQVWKHFKKKKKKKIKDFESASPLAKALSKLLGTYLDFIYSNFNIEQKANLMKVIGLEFLKFLERQIPLEKYSQSELIKLTIDLEEYDEELIDFIDEEEVNQRKDYLKALINLLKVPWDLLESYIDENDVYKRVERRTLDQFIRCVRKMAKK